MKKYLFLFVLILFITTTQTAHAGAPYAIKEGWNLVSTQVVMDMQQDKNGLDELFQNGAGLFVLNPEDKKYYGGGGAVDEIFKNLKKTFESLGDEGAYAMGWWFYSPKAFSLSMNFEVPKGAENFYKKSYRLRPGWNLVGITSIMLNKSIMDVRGTCEFVSVYHFERNQWYKQSDADLREKLTMDSMGHALAIKAADSCTFDFARSTIPSQIPSLPE